MPTRIDDAATKRRLAIWDAKTPQQKDRLLNLRADDLRKTWAELPPAWKGFNFGFARIPVPDAIDSWDDLSLETRAALVRAVIESGFPFRSIYAGLAPVQ